MGFYIVPFFTISSILTDVGLRVISIGAIINPYNHRYLLSYPNQFTLHHPEPEVHCEANTPIPSSLAGPLSKSSLQSFILHND